MHVPTFILKDCFVIFKLVCFNRLILGLVSTSYLFSGNSTSNPKIGYPK